jgi:hypothetical protein
MEGGFLQGCGYSSIEQMGYDNKGRIRSNSFTDYLIPTSMDVPEHAVQTSCVEYPMGRTEQRCRRTPLVGVPERMEWRWNRPSCGGASIHHIPFSAEDAMASLVKEGC